jgi:arylsulfatase A-like enzyme
MNAIVITFDRLPTSFLACYGNSWIETPNFDRLAARSATFHQHFAESLTLDTVRHAWWSGCYECRRSGEPQTRDWLPALLASRGIAVRLLLESGAEEEQSARELSRLFPDCTEVVAGADGLEVSPDDTPFLRLVARAQRDLRLLRTSRSEPWLLWIKSRGVPVPWLPPTEYARRFLDIEDDEPEDEPSSGEADEDDETDELEEEEEEGEEENDGALLEMSDSQFEDLLRSAAALPQGRPLRDAMTDFDRALARKVLGGYVALLDTGLGRLLETIEQSAASSPTLVLLTAAQGLSARDSGVLRDEWEQSADEIVHTPLMIRPAGLNHGMRRQSLTQPLDLFPTLLEWFGIEGPATALEGQSLLPAIRGQQSEPRRLAFGADGQSIQTVRTADHYFVQKSAEQGSEPARRLFAKPEDAWEVNDLAGQLPQLVEELAGESERFFGGGQTQTGP